MSRTRKYLDEVFPRVVARQDEAYRPIRQLNEAVNRSYERVKNRATTPRQKLVVSQKQENYNVAQGRQRQVTTKGYEPTKKQKQQYRQEDIKRAKRHRVEKAFNSDKPIVVQTPQAQLWDKDKVDLAKTQQAFYRDAAANIGVNWGNNLDPYSQSDLINNAAQSFGMSNLAPYTYPAFGTMANNIGTFIAEGIGGESVGLVGSQLLPKVWDNKYAPIVGGVLGGALGGSVGNKLGGAWTNPNSLWSKNIRTEFANKKVPIGYEPFDKNNVLPYIIGTYNTLLKRQSPLKDRLNLAIDRFGWIKSKPGESVEDYVKTKFAPDSESRRDFIRHYNRQGAFRHYLGIGDDADNLKMLTNDGKLKSYYKNDDGTYGFPFDSSDEQRFIYQSKVDNKNIKANDETGFISEVPLLTYDTALHNHGNVGGKLHYTDNDIVMDILDPWDLHPSSSLYEMSHYLPAGAEPFTLRHTIPISKNYSGLNKNRYRYNLSNIPTILGAFKRGDIIAPTTRLKIFD